MNINSSDGAELVLEGESSDDFEQFHFFRTGLDISESGLLAFVTQKGNSDALHILNTKTGKLQMIFSLKI